MFVTLMYLFCFRENQELNKANVSNVCYTLTITIFFLGSKITFTNVFILQFKKKIDMKTLTWLTLCLMWLDHKIINDRMEKILKGRRIMHNLY